MPQAAQRMAMYPRGERELEPYMECLWDLFGSIPSLYEEGRTVQDETRECNKNWEIDSKHRLWEQGFVPHDESTMGVTPETQEQMIKMMLTEEDSRCGYRSISPPEN